MAVTDPKAATSAGETPEDVATLYSWANLHGAKYRDFSASRAGQREDARQRVEEARLAELRRSQEEAERRAQEASQAALRRAAEEAEAARRAEVERLAQIARQAEEERQAVLAAQESKRRAELSHPKAPEQAFAHEADLYGEGQTGSQRMPSGASSLSGIPAVRSAAPLVQSHGEDQGKPLGVQPGSYPTREPQIPSQPLLSHSAPRFNPFDPAPRQALQEDEPLPSFLADARFPSSAPESRESGVPAGSHSAMDEPYIRPTWLQPAAQSEGAPLKPRTDASHPVIADNFQLRSNSAMANISGPIRSGFTAAGSDPTGDDAGHSASNWYALKSLFDPNGAESDQPTQQQPVQAPILALFSLAGGVGKTSIVASLGRALASRAERMLLVDTAAYGVLPFFFGAHDQRPGVLRTFNPPSGSMDAPIQMLTLDPDKENSEKSGQDWIAPEILRQSGSASRVLVDLPTASGAVARRILRLNPTVLVPVVPDMNSVVSVGAIEAFFRNVNQASGGQSMPYYLLNQFDYSQPLHLDVRELLREQTGDRLLSFALRRSSEVSEALAQGMTVMDYAPGSAVAEDYTSLAGWVRMMAAPANLAQRGTRWSER